VSHGVVLGDAVVLAGRDDDLLLELVRRAGDHAGGDRPVVLREAWPLEVVEQRLQLGVFPDGGLGEDDLLAEGLDLLFQLRVLGLRVDQSPEPGGGVAEGPRDPLGTHLEGTQDARARALETVQHTAVGLAEVDRDERQRDDREQRDNESPSADGARTS